MAATHMLHLITRRRFGWPRGDDGLTRRERRALAARYEAGPAAMPTRAELDELKARVATRKRNE
jgi:hypothetical protein